ncbi:MAG: hypothetical protein ABI905_16605 [Betaproteobacteria bacterium]
MKRLFDRVKTKGSSLTSALAGALILLVTGSGFALLHALGDGTLTSVAAPLFATV